jgi:glycosyltransferase involved in cell wall biosynthesis
MRVLHLLPKLSHLGGVERHVIDILNAFPKHLVCSGGGYLLNTFPNNHIYAPIHSKNPLIISKNRILIRKIVDHYKIDLIHVHSRAPAWSVGHLNIPVVSTFHGTYGCQNIFKKIYNSAMLKGAAVVAPSNFVKQHIEKTYKTKTPIETILQGIDTNYFSPQPYLSENIWGIKKKIILLVGRFTKLKGHEILIQATKDLDAAVVFVGKQEGHYLTTLKKMAHENVFFFEEMSDPRPAYAAAHIVVSCSIEPETFGRTTAEALSMGRLFIGTNLGATPELCGKNGVLVPPGDVFALKQALQDLLEISYEHDLRARDCILSYFSLKNMMQNLDCFYRRCQINSKP